MTTINVPWEDGFAVREANGDIFAHGKVTAAQPWLSFPHLPSPPASVGFLSGSKDRQRLCPVPQVDAGGVLGFPATHHQCAEMPPRCSSPRVSQSSRRGWGQPFCPAWRRHLCSLYPTARTLTGTSDKKLRAERPRGPSRDGGETGCQRTEGRSR